jgi:hypothetical protein
MEINNCALCIYYQNNKCAHNNTEIKDVLPLFCNYKEKPTTLYKDDDDWPENTPWWVKC